MFGTLLESNPRRASRRRTAVVSVVAHLLIIGAALQFTARENFARTPGPVVQIIPLPLPLNPQPARRNAPRVESHPFDGNVLPIPNPAIDLAPGDLPFPSLESPVDNIDRVLDDLRRDGCIDQCKPFSGTLWEGSGTAVGASRDYARPAPLTGEDLLASLLPGAPRPRYPSALQRAGVGGTVVVDFVIDSTGAVVPGSIGVVSSTHDALSRAVLDVLPRYRFKRALARGRATRMSARMPFTFTVTER